MRFSFGRGKFGAVEEVGEASWSEFVALLSEAANTPREPADKDQSPWVAPFILKCGAERRTKEDVDRLGAWFASDIDHGNWSAERLAAKLLWHSYLIYTTASSQPDDQRWRVLILLDREYSRAEHPRLWRWFNSRFDGELDPACKNANRLYYVPASWDGPPVFLHSYGKPAIVDNILAMSPDEDTDRPCVPIPASLKPAPNGQPVISRHMLEQALIAPVGRRLFRLMCAAAKVHRLNGWQLAESDLADAGLAASAQFAPGKRRENIHHEARNALAWAARNFEPQTPMQRMRSRILFDAARKAKY